MSDSESRRRLVSLGELIALGALVVSAIGVWIAWEGSNKPAQEKPTPVVEQRQAIPLALRGTADSDGRELTIAPVEQTHVVPPSATARRTDRNPIVDWLPGGLCR